MSRNNIFQNTGLHHGDSLLSNNGQWKAVFQEDGNFVVFGWSPVWCSKTEGKDAIRVAMQKDSNLVIYNRCDQPVWATNTVANCQICHLRLGDDGKLVLHRDGDKVWSSDNEPC